MRRVLFHVAVAIGLIAPAAHAGPATVHPNGDFGVVDFEVTPPVAGAPSVTIGYHGFFGNRNGERLPTQSTTIRLPRGTRSNGPFFRQCRLPATAAELGTARCPRAARVGGGTFEADARPLVAEPVTGTVEIYNGTPNADRPTLIFIAVAQVGGSESRSEVDFAFDESGRVPGLVELPPPQGAPTGVYTLTRVDITIGKTIRQRVGRRRVVTGLIVPPRTCRRAWLFEEEVTLADGRGSIVARDRVPCVR